METTFDAKGKYSEFPNTLTCQLDFTESSLFTSQKIEVMYEAWYFIVWP